MTYDQTVPVVATFVKTPRGENVVIPNAGLIGSVEPQGEGYLARTETGENWRFHTTREEAADALAKRLGRTLEWI